MQLCLRFAPGRRLKTRAELAVQLSRRVETQLAAVVTPARLRDTILAVCESRFSQEGLSAACKAAPGLRARIRT